MTHSNKFGLYIHWPYCAAKCPYCDFNSHVSARIDHTRWRAAYVTEIRRIAATTGERLLSTVFFGGGTPSLMDPLTVEAILCEIRAAWPVANDFEVTLEANPSSVDAANFAAYARSGVNRVSLGVQALNDQDLKALGRLHTVEEALNALMIAKDTFSRVSFDLIYARQNQTLETWERELAHAIDLAQDHLSLYQLTIEDGTAFGARARAGTLRGLPHEDLAADMLELTDEVTSAAGLNGYEISNHARPGAEAKHNLIYWEGGDYAGIGPGAHGRLTINERRLATQTPLQPEIWLSAVEDGQSKDFAVDVLAQDDVFAETLLMGLRLRKGVPIDRIGSNDDLWARAERLRQDGLVDISDHRLALTDRGRPLLNSVLRALLA